MLRDDYLNTGIIISVCRFSSAFAGKRSRAGFGRQYNDVSSLYLN